MSIDKTIVERTIEGLELASKTHADLTLNSKLDSPEYLVTISIAQCINKGFGGTPPPGLEVYLEKNVALAARSSLMDSIGWKKAFETDKEYAERNKGGRFDIFVKNQDTGHSHIVEVKRWDPQVATVLSDLVRIMDVLSLYSGDLDIQEGCVAYPLRDMGRSVWDQCKDGLLEISGFSFEVAQKEFTFENTNCEQPFYACGEIVRCRKLETPS